MLFPKKAKQMEPIEDFDAIDTWPIQRKFVPANGWGIKTQGLRHAQPFDGLVDA